MNSTTPTSDQARPIVIIRTEDRKVAGTTHRHSGCAECLAPLAQTSKGRLVHARTQRGSWHPVR
jgi:hypothetical protein